MKPFLFLVKQDDIFGVVNSRNETLVPIEFDNERVNRTVSVVSGEKIG